MRPTNKLNFWQIWGWPILLGLLSCIGLIAALLSDNTGDIVSWIMLAIPVIVVLVYWVKAKKK